MGQLSDPYEQGEDDGIDISLSGLPEDDFDRAGKDDEPADEVDDTPQDAVDTEPQDDLDDEDEDSEEEGDDGEDEEVAYDLTDWDDDALDALFDALEETDIPYLWDGEELFVNASDEQAVDGLLDKVTHPHQLASEDGDGDGGGWLLGELFVVADRLQHDPDEHETVARLLQLATEADEADAPYGLGDPEWDGLREKVTALASELEVDKPDPETVIEAAQELRSAVRPYV